MCSVWGFRDECEEKLNPDVYACFIELFGFLPYAARINKKIFACHGGISPQLSRPEDLSGLPCPSLASDREVTQDVVWSDPRETSSGFDPSDRGAGYMFNAERLKDFIDKNDLRLVIRCHEYCPEGFSWPFGEAGGCLTIFSSSEYCGFDNCSAVVKVDSDCNLEFEIFEAFSLSSEKSRRVLIPSWVLEKTVEDRPPVCPVEVFAEEILGIMLNDEPFDLV
jgi:diadenosine tetraphosphatase ApaH/serine/threonine PP2A family protein phosphatase